MLSSKHAPRDPSVLNHLVRLASLSLLHLGRLNPGHHLLLRDQMVNALEQTQKALHATAPLVENIIGIARLGEADNLSRPINLGIDGLRSDQLGNILLSLVL